MDRQFLGEYYKIIKELRRSAIFIEGEKYPKIKLRRSAISKAAINIRLFVAEIF